MLSPLPQLTQSIIVLTIKKSEKRGSDPVSVDNRLSTIARDKCQGEFQKCIHGNIHNYYEIVLISTLNRYFC